MKQTIEQRIKNLESQVKELKQKHILMEKAIEKKAGMLEPIRKEDFKFHLDLNKGVKNGNIYKKRK
jgi:t-SNARE complex subunit (syntaxin)